MEFTIVLSTAQFSTLQNFSAEFIGQLIKNGSQEIIGENQSRFYSLKTKDFVENANSFDRIFLHPEGKLIFQYLGLNLTFIGSEISVENTSIDPNMELKDLFNFLGFFSKITEGKSKVLITLVNKLIAESK